MFQFGPDGGEPRAIAIWHAPGDLRGGRSRSTLATTPGFVARPLASADDVRRAVATEATIAGLVVPVEPTTPVELVIDLAAPVQVRGPAPGRADRRRPARGRCRCRARCRRWWSSARRPGVARPLAGISSFQVAVPGNAVLFGFFIALTVAMAFASRAPDRHLASAARRPGARGGRRMLATLVPYFLVGLGQLAFLFGVGALVFGMQVAGSLVALVVLSLVVVYCAVSLGLLFAAIGGSEKPARRRSARSSCS